MVKMKTSTATDNMTRTLLFCALIVCSVASTANNEKETIDTKNMKEKFDSKQVDSTENWEHGTFATSIDIEKQDSTTIPGTSDTDTTDLPPGPPDTANNNSPKPENENDYNSSDKQNGSTTERIPANADNTQSKPNEPPTRTQPSSTTLIAILVNGSTTTPGTPSAVTDLDVIKSSTSRPKSKNGYSIREKYSSSKSMPTTTTTESAKPKERVRVTTPAPGWMRSTTTEDDIITSVLLSQSERFEEPERPTPAEWIKPTPNCKKNTKGDWQSRKSRRWEEELQRRHNNNRETTTDRAKSEKDRFKQELQREILEMESNRFNSILNI